MKYTRTMQKGIHSLINDIAVHTGHNTVYMREFLKDTYWGERDGVFSLALNKCNPHDAQSFYEWLLEISFDLGIEYSTFTDDP